MTTIAETDVPPGERYALYTIRDGALVELARTTLDGIGLTFQTLIEEGEFHDAYERQRPFGLRDRQQRSWLWNPYAPGVRS